MYKVRKRIIYFSIIIISLLFSYSISTQLMSAPLDLKNSLVGHAANDTGNPIGGGKGYNANFLLNKQKITVNTRYSLLKSLKNAKRNDIIFIAGDAEIDLTGDSIITIKEGVTLASDRGESNSKGGLIYTNYLDTHPLFVTNGGNIRISGLRIKGPDQNRRTQQMKDLNEIGKYASLPNSTGIQVFHAKVEIDNCELFGWSNAAIDTEEGALGVHIHHNYIHHNQREGLGYGVLTVRSDALIEANIFDWNRHAIAGYGDVRNSYEARFNIIMENSNSHSFDMHGGSDRGDGTNLAGFTINIHHNTFLLSDQEAIRIRGKPEIYAKVYDNCFSHENIESAVVQINTLGNMLVYNNKIGGCKFTY